MKKGIVIKTILMTLATGGLVAVAVLAPNALQALDLFRPNNKRGRLANRRYYINSAIGRLLNQGLIKFQVTKGKKYLTITSKGRQKLVRYQLGELKINRPKRWDGKWRVIIFDIKELRRGDRDQLRLELISLGFTKLQNSVWIHPYECEDLIMLLKSSFGLGRSLRYLVAEKLEDDKLFRTHFRLS